MKMKFGIYLNDELIKEYDDIIEAYKDAIYVTTTLDTPHEVKVIKPEKNQTKASFSIEKGNQNDQVPLHR